MKKKIIFLVILLVLFALYLSAFIYVNKQQQLYEKRVSEFKETNCNDISNIKKENIELCNEIKLYKYKDKDTLELYYDIIFGDNTYYILLIGFSIITLVFSCLGSYEIFKDGYLNNLIQRKKYNKVIFKDYLKCIRGSFIFPSILILLFIICYCLRGNIIYPNPTPNRALFFDSSMVSNIYVFIPQYFFNTWLVCLFVSQLGFFFINTSKNEYIVILKSLLAFLSFELFMAYVIGNSLCKITGNLSWFLSFSVSSAMTTPKMISVTFLTIYLIFVNLIILFINYKKYSNQERILIRNEE